MNSTFARSSFFMIGIATCLFWLYRAIAGGFETAFSYVVIAPFCLALAFSAIQNLPRFRQKREFDFIDVLPLFQVLVWAYGAVVGLVRGVTPDLVFRNYIGLWLFGLYYLLLLNQFNKAVVVQFLKLICWMSLAILVGYALTWQWRTEFFFRDRVMYSPLQWLVFMLLPEQLHRLRAALVERNWREAARSFALSFVFVTFSLVMSFSKGILLALLFVLVVIFGRGFLLSLKGKFMGAIVACGLLVVAGVASWLVFNGSTYGNIIRYQQLYEILKDVTFLGNGLGSGLESGYSRDFALPYGFELSYMGIIHKFGVFSYFLFLPFVLILTGAVKEYYGRSDTESFFLLGATVFIFVAVGNPVIYSTVSILLTVCCLYLLRMNEPRKSS